MTAETPPLRVLKAAAARIVEEITGERAIAVRQLRRGVMNIKFVVEHGPGPSYVVRFYPPQSTAAAAYEPDLVRRLRGLGLPVARIVANSRAGEAGELPYVVYEWLEGDALDRWQPDSDQQRRKLVGEVAEVLDAASLVTVHGHGDLLTASSARFDSWRAFLDSSFQAGIGAASTHRTLPAQLIDDLGRIREQLPAIDPPAAHGLAWADVREGHVLVGADGRLAGLVDFEGTLAAEPALNLGYCRAAYGNGRFARELAAAWAQRGHAEDPQRIALYAVLRGVRIARFSHMRLPAGRSRTAVHKAFPGFPAAARQLARGASA